MDSKEKNINFSFKKITKNKHFKKVFIILLVILFVISFWQIKLQKENKKTDKFDIVKVEQGDLVQTVDASGKIKSANSLQMKSELHGKISEVFVKEGDKVLVNDRLVKLNTTDLDLAVAQASANLNKYLAGASEEEVSYYESAMDMAKTSWEQSKIEAEYLISSAELSVQVALNNLKLSEEGNSEMINNTYENAATTIQQSVSTISNGLTQADNILGIDNILANDEFKQYLSIFDLNKKIQAENKYKETRDFFNFNKVVLQNISLLSDKKLIDEVLIISESILEKVSETLLLLKDVLDNTPPTTGLAQTALDGKKTNINNTRVSVMNQFNQVVNSRQNIETAKNSYQTYLLAYEKAENDLNNIKQTSQKTIELKESAYNQAVANYNLKKNPPREVDVASLRTSLSQAVINREKAILKSPIEGIVTKIYKKVGEFINMSEVAIDILSPQFQIEIDVPEVDVIKLKLQDEAKVTLDAYGSDIEFLGKIISIDPASTDIMDVVYYRVTIALEESEYEVKPGMSANATIYTDMRTNVLKIPSRAVKSNEKGKYVRVLKNGALEEVYVTLGIRSDDGQVEVIDGLDLNDEVVINYLSS